MSHPSDPHAQQDDNLASKADAPTGFDRRNPGGDTSPLRLSIFPMPVVRENRF